MRKLLVVIFLCCAFKLFAQDTLRFEMTQDIEYAKTVKNSSIYQVYVCKDGSILKVGDTLKINQPQGGQTVTSGRIIPTYQYIYLGHFTLGKAILTTPVALSGTLKRSMYN